MAKYIYGLIDPTTNQIRYVGQTDDLGKRLQQHMQDGSNTPKVEWLRGLKSNGQQAIIIVLSVVKEGENAHEIEYRWIYLGRQNGWPLTNTAAMKTMEYYSLQGYFERLIVEMEKPEGIPEQKYSWKDIKEKLIWLFTVGLDNIPDFASFAREVLPTAFSLITAIWCVIYIVSRMGNFENGTDLLLFFITMISVIVVVPVNIAGKSWVKVVSAFCFIGLYYSTKMLI